MPPKLSIVMNRIVLDKVTVWVLLIFVFGLFCLFQYKIFLFGYYRAHGDFSQFHFVSAYFLDALSSGLEIPIWQPYKNLGSPNIWGLICYNPLITVLSFLIHKIVRPMGLLNHSLFQVTWLAYALTYAFSFGLGCYWLAKDNLQTKSAQVACFAMALMGTQIYFLVYTSGYLLFFVPYFLIFLVRLLRNDGYRLGADFFGLVLAFCLIMATNYAYINFLINFFLLLAAAAWISGVPFGYHFQAARACLYRGLAVKRRTFMVLFVLVALAMVLLSLKLLLVTRLDEVTTPRRQVEVSGSNFVEKNIEFIRETTKSHFSNNLVTIVENLANCISYDRKLHDYTFPRLYFGLFPIIVFVLMWPRIKDRIWTTFLLATIGIYLMSTNSNDNYNIVLPASALVNPLLNFGTRHANVAVILASPMIILLLGMALDRFLLIREAGQQAFEEHRRLVAVLCLLSGIAAVIGHNGYLAYFTAVLAVFWAFTFVPSGVFLRTGVPLGYLVLLIIVIELAIPFHNFTKTFFHPFGKEPTGQQFGPNLPGPPLGGFPGPFWHTFSYWFDVRGLVTTQNNHYEIHNPAFKFFSTARFPVMEMKGLSLDEMPFLRRHNERLFFVDNVVWADRQSDLLGLTSLIFEADLNNAVAAVQRTGDSTALDSAIGISGGHAGIERIVRERSGSGVQADPLVRSRSIAGETFRLLRSQGTKPGVKIFEAPLPADFPQYLTTNPYNDDAEDVELVDSAGCKFKRTYFDVFADAREFQINFARHGMVELATDEEQPSDVTVTWNDRFAAQGIQVVKFTYNSLTIITDTNRDRFLVYVDRFSERWKCYIDGSETPIYRTNIEFKGVLVPRGRHEVHFVYCDPVLKIALMMYTLGYLAACVIVVVLTVRVRKPLR